AHLLRLKVIGIRIPGREHISADHDPSFDLPAEAGGPRVLIHLDDILARDPHAVAYAIITGEVRGCFRRSHDLVCRQGISRMRKRDTDDLRARIPQPPHALLPQRLDLTWHPFHAVLLRDSDLHALDRPANGGLIV